MHFSIITVTKNDPDGLKETHSSIQSQNFHDYEWIVIDGEKEPDAGIYDAMNKGLSRATGHYVIFMNGGDSFANETVLDSLAKYDADFLYGDAIEEEFVKTAKQVSKINGGMITSHQAMCYKHNVIDKLQFDLNYKIAADYKFTLQFLQKAQNHEYLAVPICIFEPHGISQNNMKSARREEQKIRQELKIKSMFIPLRQCIASGVRAFSPRLYFALRG